MIAPRDLPDPREETSQLLDGAGDAGNRQGETMSCQGFASIPSTFGEVCRRNDERTPARRQLTQGDVREVAGLRLFRQRYGWSFATQEQETAIEQGSAGGAAGDEAQSGPKCGLLRLQQSVGDWDVTANSLRTRKGTCESMDGPGPENTVKLGEGRLSVLLPQLGDGTQRDQPPVIVGITDTAEVVFAAKARGVRLVDQTAQQTCLEPNDILVIESGELATSPMAEQGVHQTTDGTRICQPLR
jgi:hypothetical protein